MKFESLVLRSAIYFALPATLLAALAPEQMAEMRTKCFESGVYGFDVRKLTAEEKSYLVTVAHEVIEKDPFNDTRFDSKGNEALVMLGDEEATKNFVAQYRETGRDAEPLILSYNPKIIAALSEDLSRNDPWPSMPIVGEQPVMPPSFRVCLVMERLLQGAPDFSKEVNDWATRNFQFDPQRGGRPMTEHRSILRKWWKDNERFFKSGDYKSVKPGDELVATNASINVPENRIGLGGTAKSPTEVSDLQQLPERRSVASQFRYGFLFLVAAIILSIVGGLIALRRRR